MSELISIVIPVYNKEPYLADCFDSLRQQTYEDIEVILVDDGSTDGSADVCRKYVEMDSRFHYIHQENGGQNSARQKGAENASGDYLIFVDADDYVSNDMCRLLMDNMEKTDADIVCGSMQNVRDVDLLEKTNPLDGVYTPEEIMEEGFIDGQSLILKSDNYVNTVIWNVLYRKSAVLDALEHMDMRIRLGEDTALWFYIVLNSKRISYISDIVYFYRRVENSASKLHVAEGVEQLQMLGVYLKKLFVQKGFSPKYDYVIDAWILRDLYFSGMEYFNDFDGIFPYFKGDRSGSIAIYGAGTFGAEFYAKASGLDIVGWYDKNYEFYQKQGIPVKNPDELLKQNFDYILVTIWRESTAKAVIKELRRALPEDTRIYAISPDVLNSDYTRRKIRALLDTGCDVGRESFRSY